MRVRNKAALGTLAVSLIGAAVFFGVIPVQAINLGNSINLSQNHSGHAIYPSVAQSGEYTYVAWNDGGQAHFQRMANGQRAGAKINVSQSQYAYVRDVTITASGNYVYMAWTDGIPPLGDNNACCASRIAYLAISKDRGATFSDPQLLHVLDLADLKKNSTFAWNPTLGADNNTVSAMWVETRGPNPGMHIKTISLSTDPNIADIVTYKHLSTHPDDGGGFHNDFSVDVADTGVYAAWHDARSGQILMVRSVLGGGFGTPKPVESTTTTAIDSVRIIATDAVVYIAWRGGASKIHLGVSRDEGQSFTHSVVNDTINNSCGANRQICFQLATNEKIHDELWIAWNDGRDSFYRKYTNYGQSSGNTGVVDALGGGGVAPAISVSGTNMYLAWIAPPGLNGYEVFVAASKDSGATTSTINVSQTDGQQSFAESIAAHGPFFDVVWSEWFSNNAIDTLYKRGSTAEADLELLNVSATQAPDNPTRLVKGKPTVVKATVRNGFTVKKTIKARLSWSSSRGPQEKDYSVTVNPGDTTVTLPTRKNIVNDSTELNDFIRPDQDAFNFKVELDIDGEVSETQEGENNVKENAYPVVDTKGIRVLVVPIRIRSDDAVLDYSDCTAFTSATEAYTEAIFPVDDRESHWSTHCSAPLTINPITIHTSNDLDQLNRLLMDRLQKFGWSGQYTKVIALMPKGWFGKYYMIKPEEPAPIGVAPWEWTNAVLTEYTERPSLTAAHELIHNYGFRAADGDVHQRVQAEGYWVKPRLGQQHARDIMWPGAGEFEWIANNTYDYLLSKLERIGNDPTVIALSGTIWKDGRTDISPWYTIDGLIDAELNQSGEFTLEYVDASGNTLEHTGFDANYTYVSQADSEEDSHETVTTDAGFFTIRVPVVPGTAKLVIKRGDQVLHERAYSAHAPTVTIQTPQNGQRFNVGGTVNIAWQGADQDGDNLHYIAAFSKDGGNTWLPLEADITDTHISFTAGNDSVTDNGLIKISATDGLNTTEVRSQPFIIEHKVGNGKIAFEMRDRATYSAEGIWIANPDGTDLKRLTEQGQQPRWSRDGKTLAVIAPRTGESDAWQAGLWTIAADGTKLTQLYYEYNFPHNPTALLQNLSCPQWSADSSAIAFIGQEEATGRKDIWSINTDGTNLRKLHDWPDGSQYTPIGCPDLSPDGAKIVFNSGGEIYTGNPNLTGVTRLTDTATRDENADPRWSPDGNKIVYRRWASVFQRKNYDTWVMDANGANKTQLTSNYDPSAAHPASNSSLEWSPDGTQIAYGHVSATSNYFLRDLYDLWTMKADGSAQTRQTNFLLNTLTMQADYPTTQAIAWQPLVAASEPDPNPVKADAGGPYTAKEGENITLDGSKSTATGQIESYKWDLDSDGQFDDATGAKPETSYPEDGQFTVSVEVTDTAGQRDVAEAMVTTQNSIPSLSDMTVVVDEDGLASMQAKLGDAGTQDTSTATIDWGDGSPASSGSVVFYGDAVQVFGSHIYAQAGTYTVTATITDDDGGQSALSGPVVKAMANMSPTATGATVDIDQDVFVEIPLSVTDPDKDMLTFKVVTPPEHGSLDVLDGPDLITTDKIRVLYSPNKGFFGDDSFTYAVHDGKADSNVATVNIKVTPTNQPPICSTARPNIASLWPPNHEFVPITIQGVTDPDNNPLTITVKSVKQDEAVDEKGDGAFVPDAKISSGNVQLRAERAGTGNGRVYHIYFSASDSQGGECTGKVNVEVPHNANKPAVNDGEQFDATQDSAFTGLFLAPNKHRAVTLAAIPGTYPPILAQSQLPMPGSRR